MAGNSNLASYIDNSSTNFNERTKSISKITIHIAAGSVTLDGLSRTMHDSSREVSWNYGIDDNGKIGLYIPEKYRAWTSSSQENDNVAVTIEVSNTVAKYPWPISDAAYSALLNLCEDICRRNNIPALNYTGNKSGNLTMHRWFSNKECPGDYLAAKFSDIAKQVNARLKKKKISSFLTNPETSESTSAGDAFLGTTADIASMVDYTSFTPYIATISPSVKSFDGAKLKDLGVVGVAINSGTYFDSVHIQNSTYRSQNLDAHIKSAVSANLPFSLYTEIRSKTVSEVNRELDELQLCVQKYNPTMGVWIQIGFQNSKSMNNDIIDRCKKRLFMLGLKNKIGLYCTLEKLKLIDWKERSEDWLLWLDSHVSDVSEFECVLNPEFFMTGYD